ncbi:efflux RND transporter periplasmic adaptor subunit [Mucilaginibacter sp. 14171R-50]|uniref:efflux RND transporter periplasmic adaptor subunit n=1 Tax=Mucilaginibacter sp. 14171R-50 TaxID=2703789 RepID=UPI00138B4B98|nr:efflux RND transporter periplasmic adaptor subunit [Mucilaginibacter sp. 14171R-50]QHS55260.1 efflux RND transporter periplasmic adaptor subunit [Mucilaginibacter sp. 14171R-50]
MKQTIKNKYIQLFVLLPLALIVAIGTGCKQKKEPAETEQKEVPKDKADEGTRLTQSQIDAVGIGFGTVEQKNLKSVVKVTGQLDVPPQNKAEVTLQMGGVVKQIFVLEGGYVHKGQQLATIENNQLIQLQQDYMTALSSLAYAEKEYQRQSELNAQNAGTGKVYQQSESTYQADQARVKALGRQLAQVGINPANAAKGKITTEIPVFAPISGTIGKISIETGSFAEPSKPLMNIVDNSKVHCDLMVYEKDLAKVKAGQKVNFTLTNQNNLEISGRIYGVNQSFENETKSVIAHAIIDNSAKNNLIQGMYVSASIDVGNQTTTAVPNEAIVKSGGKDYIYYLKKVEEKTEGNEEKEKTGDKDNDHKAPGKVYYFDKAEVITGVSDLGYTEIKLVEELPKGVKIVTKGAFYILSSTSATDEDGN